MYFLLENFEECPEKTKTFRKINRSCFGEYFYRYVLKVDKISFKIIFFKMLRADV